MHIVVYSFLIESRGGMLCLSPLPLAIHSSGMTEASRCEIVFRLNLVMQADQGCCVATPLDPLPPPPPVFPRSALSGGEAFEREGI